MPLVSTPEVRSFSPLDARSRRTLTRARRQITYHGGDNGKNMPIFSVDMHPDTDPLLLATAGTDAETRVRFLARHALFVCHQSELFRVQADSLSSNAIFDV